MIILFSSWFCVEHYIDNVLRLTFTTRVNRNDDVKTRTNPDIIQQKMQTSKYTTPYFYLFAS